MKNDEVLRSELTSIVDQKNPIYQIFHFQNRSNNIQSQMQNSLFSRLQLFLKQEFWIYKNFSTFDMDAHN